MILAYCIGKKNWQNRHTQSAPCPGPSECGPRPSAGGVVAFGNLVALHSDRLVAFERSPPLAVTSMMPVCQWLSLTRRTCSIAYARRESLCAGADHLREELLRSTAAPRCRVNLLSDWREVTPTTDSAKMPIDSGRSPESGGLLRPPL